MSRSIRIRVLVENCVRKQGLLAEHGLAWWIEAGDQCVLFDAGQGLTLSHNAQRLGIDLSRANAIALSHGHYDHTGGLPQALAAAPRAKLFLHPQALNPRYTGKNGKTREIGMPLPVRQLIEQAKGQVAWTQKPTEIIPGVFLTGEIPRDASYEDTGGDFFLDPQSQTLDPIIDDQAIYFQAKEGVVVVLGCAHSGIINTLRYVRWLTSQPIHAVVGGAHLVNATDDRLRQTLLALKELNPSFIAPAHCTGPKAMAALWTVFPNAIADCAVGSHWIFD